MHNRPHPKHTPIFLFDVTSIVRYLFKLKKQPTGIQHVYLAYINNYAKLSCVTLVYQHKRFVFDSIGSQIVLDHILHFEEYNKNLNVGKLLVKLFKHFKPISYINNMILINVGEDGLKLSEKRKQFLLKYNIKVLSMAHDVLPIQFSEYFPVDRKHKFTLGLNGMINESSFLILNSRDTELKLKQYAKLNSFKMPPYVTSLLGSNINLIKIKNKPLSLNKLPKKYVERPYFVILGTIEPRKNHITLLNIWRRMLETTENKERLPNLVIIGQRGWNCNHVFDMLDSCEVIKDYVFELNSCGDSEVHAYLNGAQALLFPSFTEGYGLPLVEALGLGTPAIVSDIPVFHEIAGNIPEYIDPLDAITWIKVIMEYSEINSKMRNAQLERIKKYTLPTWEEHFSSVDKIINLNPNSV